MKRTRQLFLAVFVTMSSIGHLVTAAEQIAASNSLLQCRPATSGTSNYLACTDPHQSELQTKDVVALGLGGVALLLSILSFIYTRRKDARARRQSIEDEFWLRAVLGPVAIEPLVNQMLETIRTLPEDCASPQSDSTSLNDFVKRYQVTHYQLATSLHSLALLDKTLCASAIGHFDTIEDVIIEFCASNAGKHRKSNGQCAKPRAETQAFIREKLFDILRCVKSYQIAQV